MCVNFLNINCVLNYVFIQRKLNSFMVHCYHSSFSLFVRTHLSGISTVYRQGHIFLVCIKFIKSNFSTLIAESIVYRAIMCLIFWGTSSAGFLTMVMVILMQLARIEPFQNEGILDGLFLLFRIIINPRCTVIWIYSLMYLFCQETTRWWMHRQWWRVEEEQDGNYNGTLQSFCS